MLGMCMCAYVFVYACMCVCTFARVCLCAYMYVCKNKTCVGLCIDTFMYGNVIGMCVWSLGISANVVCMCHVRVRV